MITERSKNFVTKKIDTRDPKPTLINPDGIHRPAVDEIKEFLNK